MVHRSGSLPLYNVRPLSPTVTDPDVISENGSVCSGALKDSRVSWVLAHLLEMEALKGKKRLRSGEEGGCIAQRDQILSRMTAGRRNGILDAVPALLDKAERLGIKMVHPESPDYPALLSGLSTPPFLLWARGEMAALERPAIAMVGAREAGLSALEGFSALSREIVSLGWTVVSGLARGMDGAAHRGALFLDGRTVAVVGTGLDRIYPPEHGGLEREIRSRGGAILSEFSPGEGPEGWHFPHRNRMIVGLSMAVVVGAHRRRSGTYVTARIALEEGREVFVFDGGTTGWEKEGPDLLLGEGARRVESALDIVRALTPGGRKGQL